CAGTIVLRWENGVFNALDYVEDVWLEEEFVPSPLGISMDAAVRIMHDAGFPEPFLNVTIRKPLGPVAAPEAYYIFPNEAARKWIFVGVESGEIHTEDMLNSADDR
ncbi:MAG: hypothetical protein GYA55_01780, partial [SAR324 cluster bacterium]|nr:hypothetical protein [SAR324 cluster bacterium]